MQCPDVHADSATCGTTKDGSYVTEVKGINTVTTAPVVDEVDMWASEVLAKTQREDLQLKEFYKLKEGIWK